MRLNDSEKLEVRENRTGWQVLIFEQNGMADRKNEIEVMIRILMAMKPFSKKKKTILE